MDYIQTILQNSPVVLFMKGTPEMPFCGFSRYVVQVLNNLKVPFQGVNILDNESLRADLKVFSCWPTFPQLYVNGTFIGGCDIVKELYTTGELQRILPSPSDEEEKKLLSSV